MVTVYTSNSCASCRKAIKWLEENHIEYKEINFFTSKLSKDDIVYMLKNSDNGFEDIISTRSKIFSELNLDIDELKFNDLVDLILKHPSILKRPIIVNDVNLQVGYNDDDIRVFIPKEVRAKWVCENCKTCNFNKDLNVALTRIKDKQNNKI